MKLDTYCHECVYWLRHPCILSVSIPDNSWHVVTQDVSSDICVDESFAMSSKDKMDVKLTGVFP